MEFKIQSINCDFSIFWDFTNKNTKRCENRSTFIKVTFPNFPSAYFKLMLLKSNIQQIY